ncbi:High-affinity methionine permease [Grifola frondosa]|uniref:High-affinity methionine permease n=1 Tax=Grifola frondosa TaxID=5627 RepID=A0A1C7LNI7_GRIFR|nr:High-affinity methionine permease [Grifola frondosa]
MILMSPERSQDFPDIGFSPSIGPRFLPSRNAGRVQNTLQPDAGSYHLEDAKSTASGSSLKGSEEAASSLHSGPEADAAGGMGRHLGVFSCTLLIVGRIIGTGIFSTPSSILGSVGSIGASMMLWVPGFMLSFCELFIWLELGTMIPRSGGEKVYLEAMYKKPSHLGTLIFAANAVLLGFTSSGCIVFASNILVAAGQEADRWATRGIALGAIFFVGSSLYSSLSLAGSSSPATPASKIHARTSGTHSLEARPAVTTMRLRPSRS